MTINANLPEHAAPVTVIDLMLNTVAPAAAPTDLLSKVVALNKAMNGTDLRSDN